MKQNNKKISVSVGISAYNEEKNINLLLRSLLRQIGHNFSIIEMIVISDGSTDNTVHEIKKIKDRRIRLIEEKVRMGQTSRQNQILDIISPRSDCFLRMEADTLPADNTFIQNLISRIPRDNNYSLITGKSIPVKSRRFIGKVIEFSYSFRHELYEKSLPSQNLYTLDICLFSKKFLNKFRWENGFHEDSFCYRKAIESGLPIISSPKAVFLFKAVESVSDYLTQSTKFQKAKQKESQTSNIYSPKMKYTPALKVILSYLLKNPIYLTTYVSLLLLSRVVSQVAPNYSEFWQIYKTTKQLT